MQETRRVGAEKSTGSRLPACVDRRCFFFIHTMFTPRFDCVQRRYDFLSDSDQTNYKTAIKGDEINTSHARRALGKLGIKNEMHENDSISNACANTRAGWDSSC